MSSGELRQLELQVRQMQARIDRLNREMDRRPIMTPGGPTLRVLEIIDGQTVYSSGGGTNIYGIQRASPALTEVQSLWDPNSVASTAGLFSAEAGIGRARLYINGVVQSSLVLVVHDNRSGNLLSTSLVNLDAPETFTTVTLPLHGDATQSVTAYVPFRP